MKKIILFAFASVLLVSCKTETKPQQPIEAISVATETTPPADSHNAKNSLDYMGTYKGVLPTASGQGMEVTVNLTDSTYTKDELYVGKKLKPIQTKGSYTWNEEGNTITLTNAEKPNQYFVSEGKLTHLDMDGNKITGDNADKYVLSKQ